MAALTLEQVRDEILNTARAGARLEPQTCHYLADAIDAEIKARGEPVHQVRLQGPINAWVDVHAESSADYGNDVKRSLYTAPPAPKIEVTDAMVRNLARAMERDESEARAYLEAALKDTP